MTDQTSQSDPGISQEKRIGLTLRVEQGGRAPVRGRTSDTVTSTLREAILDGVLGPGSWLREAELARELSVSRTPVRDALRTLASEGLLSLNANQGAIVTTLNSDDIRNIYTVREALEAVAARLAAQRGDRAFKDRLRKLIAEMRPAGSEGRFEDLARMNFEFHEIVLEATNNAYLERPLSQLQNAVHRFPEITLELPGRLDESVEEHATLAEAIIAGDPDKAESLASKHIRHLADVRIRMLIEGGPVQQSVER